jgi:hypothetical protein
MFFAMPGKNIANGQGGNSPQYLTAADALQSGRETAIQIRN